MSEILVLTTFSDVSKAKKLAQILLKEKVAACINILPQIYSSFRWKGKTVSSREVLVIIKSRQNLYKKIESLIEKHHSYEVPEILAIKVSSGSKKYLQWLQSELVK